MARTVRSVQLSDGNGKTSRASAGKPFRRVYTDRPNRAARREIDRLVTLTPGMIDLFPSSAFRRT